MTYTRQPNKVKTAGIASEMTKRSSSPRHAEPARRTICLGRHDGRRFIGNQLGILTLQLPCPERRRYGLFLVCSASKVKVAVVLAPSGPVAPDGSVTLKHRTSLPARTVIGRSPAC